MGVTAEAEKILSEAPPDTRLRMPVLMRNLAAGKLQLEKTTRKNRDELRVSHGPTIGVLASALSMIARDSRQSIVHTSQVAVMAAHSWITADSCVSRCIALAPDALNATKADPFCESLYKSSVPYKPQGRVDDSFYLWSPSMELIDAVSSQARDCGMPQKWFIQSYVCGVLADYGDAVLGRYAAPLRDEYELGRRWIQYRADHVLSVVVENGVH